MPIDENEARYLFDPEKIRRADEPSDDSARLIWMLLRLIRRREIDYASYAKNFRRGEKTFRRDVAKLRRVGDWYDFSLTQQRKGRVALSRVSGIANALERATDDAADTLRAVANALGELVANDIAAASDTSSAPHDPFLRLAMPRLIEESAVAKTFKVLREAWRDRARVRFRYAGTERIVEPHLVTYFDGRYYLVAYDARPKTAAWRQFALDRIEGVVVRSGTFERRIVPQNYRGEDAIGLFKSIAPTEVTIALSPDISASVLARRWQCNQRTLRGDAGWPVVAFDVSDLGEVVRWAFGFGEYARIVSPPEAVALARDLALAVFESYAPAVRKEA